MEGRMKRHRNTVLHTADIVKKARRHMTVSEIAGKCGVAEATIYRWAKGAPADIEAIKPLISGRSPIASVQESSIDLVSDSLVELYLEKGRFSIADMDLKKLAKRRSLVRGRFLGKLTERLLNRGYYLIEADGDVFMMFSLVWLQGSRGDTISL